MSDPCQQEPYIRRLEKNYHETYQRLDSKIDTVINHLNKLGIHQEQISSLGREIVELKMWVKTHDEKIEALKEVPGKMALKLVFAGLSSGFVVGGGIVATAVVFYLQKG